MVQTPLRPQLHAAERRALLANASAGLDKRSTDAIAVAAVFERRSYKPGDVAVLRLWGRYPVVTVELLHVGPEQQLTIGNQTMEGIRVAGPIRVNGTRGTIRDPDRQLAERRLLRPARARREAPGFAPFVVRPRTLGEHPVLVVEPTYTWQAYNFRDDNDDGRGDTWYDSSTVRTVRQLDRPFLSRGMPPHFLTYDLPFLQWLAQTGRRRTSSATPTSARFRAAAPCAARTAWSSSPATTST